MSYQYVDPHGRHFVRGWGNDFTEEERRKLEIGEFNWNSPNYEGKSKKIQVDGPNFPRMEEDKPNGFQDAKRRGLAGVIGGALDKLTGGFTDFDKRGDSPRQAARKEALLDRGRDFLKEFVFGTEKAKGPVPMPEYPLPNGDVTPVPMPEYPLPNGDVTPVPMPEYPLPDSEKTTTQKVEEFLDPTGKQAEKRLDNINIEGKDYKIYTDRNTGEEFIPFDPRISGSKGDFDRHGKPLTEEEKTLIQQGARIQSSRLNPYTEEDQRKRAQQNLMFNPLGTKK